VNPLRRLSSVGAIVTRRWSLGLAVRDTSWIFAGHGRAFEKSHKHSRDCSHRPAVEFWVAFHPFCQNHDAANESRA
jgi:hypothetical protein